jgi:hypothetical protein
MIPTVDRYSPNASAGTDRVFGAVTALVGTALVLGALTIIWVTRLAVPRAVYVSELGADGEPTARIFEFALVTLVIGASAIAWAGRRIRSDAWLLRRWAPSVSLWVGAAGFLLASQVPCTAGCPLPLGNTFSVQDLVHTLAAVISFGAACAAMVQCAFAVGRRRLASISLGAGVSVAVIAGAGGILSLLRFGTDVGSALELLATTAAIMWLSILGIDLAREQTAVTGVPDQGGAQETAHSGPGHRERGVISRPRHPADTEHLSAHRLPPARDSPGGGCRKAGA